MIARYTDHAANERTFLAWVRTALAMMAFGGILARTEPTALPSPSQHGMATDAGLACVAIGVGLLPAAYCRYRRTRVAIGGEEISAPERSTMEDVLAGSLLLFGMAVLVMLVRSSAI